MSKRDLVKLLISEFVTDNGDLDLTGLDFSNFNGDVFIDEMIVNGDLYQGGQNAFDIMQQNHNTSGRIYQQQTTGNIYNG